MKSIAGSIVIALAIIIAAFLFSNAYQYKFKTSETISVTGSAEVDFVSDQIVWSANYSRKSMDLKSVYATLKEDEKVIKQYLLNQGVKESDIVFSAVRIDKDYESRYQDGRLIGSFFTGYNLSQTVTVDSREIQKVEKISREVTGLIESGIELNSYAPSYYYSKLSELKIDLLAKASADAHLRAETIAKNAGGKLGEVKKANMGVFQILGKNSDEEYSYGGTFNTSSKEKKATITTRMEFMVK